VTALPEHFRAAVDDTWADRRRADGTRTVWLLSSRYGKARMTRWDRAGTNWVTTSEEELDSVAACALQADSDWLTLREDEVTTYQAPETSILLDALTADGDDGDPDEIDWPFNVDRFLAEDDLFDQRDGLLRRYARINGQRIQFAASGDDYVAFLSDGEEVLGEQLADFGWGSEAGMGSGAGGWTLYQSGTRHAVAIPFGDNAEAAMRGYTFASDPQGTAQLLREWMDHVEGWCLGVFGAAALALEPLDPAGVLTPERRHDWEAELASLTSGYGDTIELTVYAEPAVIGALRAKLSTEETYRLVKEALADPVKGDWVRAALAEGDDPAQWASQVRE